MTSSPNKPSEPLIKKISDADLEKGKRPSKVPLPPPPAPPKPGNK